MRKIDRLGWAAGFAFECFGLRLGVRVNDPGLLPRIEALLPLGWRRSGGREVEHLFSFRVGGRRQRGNIRDFHIGYVDSDRAVRADDLQAALNAFEGHILLLVAALARTHIFVHAGVVALGQVGILLPGRSQAGKSTLVAALLDRGCLFYSDEFAPLLDDGRVASFPAPLKLRHDGGSLVRQAQRAEVLPPTRVGLVVLTRFSPRVRVWRPRSVLAGQAILDLLANTVPARYQPSRSLDALARVVATAEVVKGLRGEAGAASDAIVRRAEALRVDSNRTGL